MEPISKNFSSAAGSRKSLRLRLIAVCLSASLTGTFLPTSASAGQQYTAAAGDVLQITVYGDATLSGKFAINDDGTITYPLIGSVSVAGKTTQQIGAAIGKSLSEHVPTASVMAAIAEYGPVFVLGDVRAPGKYEYRPGMIALELLAMAGGVGRLEKDPDGATLQLIATRQEYADLELQLFAQQVRRKRVQAELDQTDLSYPPVDLSDPIDPSTRQALIDRELSLFTIRRNALAADETALEAQEKSFQREIETITESIKLHDQEIALLVEDVAASQSLADRGLTAKSNLRQTERDLSATRRDALELQSYLARAEQSKLAIGQRRTALLDQRKTESATALQAIDYDSARMKEKQGSLLSSMAEIASSAGRAAAIARDTRMIMTVTRSADGQYQEISADDRLEIHPGDILRIEFGVPKVNRQASAN